MTSEILFDSAWLVDEDELGRKGEILAFCRNIQEKCLLEKAQHMILFIPRTKEHVFLTPSEISAPEFFKSICPQNPAGYDFQVFENAQGQIHGRYQDEHGGYLFDIYFLPEMDLMFDISVANLEDFTADELYECVEELMINNFLAPDYEDPIHLVFHERNSHTLEFMLVLKHSGLPILKGRSVYDDDLNAFYLDVHGLQYDFASANIALEYAYYRTKGEL